ncbi:MAG: pyruvate kinase [Opitutales bacterium]
MDGPYRHTKIIFTVGPATAQPEVLEQLVREGVDICRLNMAHASHQWTREVIGLLRAACEKEGRQVATLMDVKGPEIRTGDVGEPYELAEGEIFDFVAVYDRKAEPPLTPSDLEKDSVRCVTVNYPDMIQSVQTGGTLLVDSGLVRMQILEILEDRIRCKVIIPGPLGNRRHINLPGVKVNLPALTRKDRADVDLGVELKLDYYALSFVREADDLDILRAYLHEKGDESARIVAKIEDQSGISNLGEIIQASDGLMVARGDLGIECPFEQLPLIQRRAVNDCINENKPVIIATHMLESMIEQPLPTRAEVTDIANAVFEQADAVMLSGETTTGKYPVECVRVMKRIIRSTERVAERNARRRFAFRTAKAKMLNASVVLAQELENAAIVVFTRSGYLAQILSSIRPSRCPIFAFTDREQLFRQLLLVWGVEPFLLDFDADPEVTIRESFRYLLRQEWVQPGQWLVVITNVIASEQVIDSIQMRQVEA